MSSLLAGVKRHLREDVVFRLWAAIILAIVLATGVYTSISVTSLKVNAAAEFKERADRLADVLAKSLARPLFDINSVAVESVGVAVGLDPEVLRLRVIAPDGAVLVDEGGPLNSGQGFIEVRRNVSYVAEGQTYAVGRIELTLASLSGDNKLRWQMTQAGIAWLILAVAISLALYLVARHIMRPFGEIQVALEKLASGDTQVSLSGLGREDQIGRLSVAVERFRNTLDELRLANQRSSQLLAEKSTIANRLKAVYEGTSDCVMLLTDQGFFDCNSATLEMFRMATREEFTACHPSDLSPEFQPDGRPSSVAANERIARAFSSGQCRFEWVHRRRDGSEFPAEVLLSAFDYDGSRVLQATVRDITERKRIEQELQRFNQELESLIAERTLEISNTLIMLKESKSKLQTIVDTALDAVVRVNAEGIIVGWNTQAEAIFGWTAAEAIGHSLEETIIPPEHRAAHGNGMRRYMASGISTVIDRRIEISALRRSGDSFPIELAITRVALEDASKFEFCAFIRDITQRRQAEDDIRASLEKQRELNQLKSRFVTMASHEFRTPLATILSSTELLQHYLDRLPANEREELFQSISRAVKRMTGMLEDVLLIGKDEAERAEFRPTPLSLDRFFEELLKEVKAEQADGGQRDTEVRLLFEGGNRLAHFDETLLRHIFGNLLSNAIKYSPNGTVVELIVQAKNDGFEVTVTDSGIGIPESDLPRLFETFHRGTNVGNIPGTGLGLAIVKRSVDLHLGTISVDSKAGVGTRFTVHLPRLTAKL